MTDGNTEDFSPRGEKSKDELSFLKKRFRNICVTIFGVSCSNDVDEKNLRKYFKLYAFQTEVSKQKKLHVQFYGELRKQMSGNQIKKIFGNSHTEARIGSRNDCVKYCLKSLSRIGSIKDSCRYYWDEEDLTNLDETYFEGLIGGENDIIDEIEIKEEVEEKEPLSKKEKLLKLFEEVLNENESKKKDDVHEWTLEKKWGKDWMKGIMKGHKFGI